MRFFKSFLVTASALATAVAAQSSTLYFTRVPTALTGVTAGVPYTLSYVAPDNSMPVTITLRKGDPSNLGTIVQLTNSATGGDYTWTPSSSLVDAGDYALDIKQGDQVNYSNQFKLLGGAATAPAYNAVAPSSSSVPGPMSISTSAMSISTSAMSISTAPMSISTAPSVASYATISSASSSSQVSSFRSAIGMSNSSYIAATSTAAARNGSAIATSYASAGVIPMSRNTTLASASLVASSTGSATMTILAYVGSATVTGPLQQTGTNNAVLRHNSPVALILGAVVAFAYLN